ncbi:MAG: GDP-mannose 4,6-dehydratase [Dehalococcoidia bacterium]|jgi:UDP-glucose 4-epimerase
MKFKDKKMLVVGGAGFIGSHVVDALVRDNRVTVLDNLSSGKRENIRHHLDKGTIEFVEADITDLPLMRKLTKEKDVIFNLAVQCLRLSFSDPYLVHDVNATGSLNLCQAAYENGTERFVYISSSEVYGTAKTAPMNEDHPMAPTTPYGASKLAGEAYARSYYLSFGLPVTVVRPFNTYGPREHLEGAYGEVIPRFMLRAMNNLPPIIFGDGEQTRDFTEVRDIARGIVLAGECDDLVGQNINIAAGREVTINEIARIVIDVAGQSGELAPIYMEERPGDVRRHFADISKARDILDFEARTGIEEGIKKYYDWVSKQNWDLKNLQEDEVIINWR